MSVAGDLSLEFEDILGLRKKSDLTCQLTQATTKSKNDLIRKSFKGFEINPKLVDSRSSKQRNKANFTAKKSLKIVLLKHFK